MKFSTMKKLKIVLLLIVGLPIVYLLGGLVLHNYVYPTHTPDYTAYFRNGTSFTSKWEGITFKVVSFNPEQRTIRVDMQIKPGGGQTVAHEHDFFAQQFTVKRGTLSAVINGISKNYSAGESVTISAGTIHKLFNNSDSVVELSASNGKGIIYPIDYIYALSQLYGHWDLDPTNREFPKLYFHLAILHKQFDSWTTEKGPSKTVQKILRVLMAPTARFMKYEIYDYRFTPLLPGEPPME